MRRAMAKFKLRSGVNSAFNLELEAEGSIGQEKGVYMNGGHYA